MDMENKETTQNEATGPSMTPEEIMQTISDNEMVDEGDLDDDEEYDLDDVQVHHAEGMLIKQNEDEVRMLFFYIKPSKGPSSRYKAVTELRIPRRRFNRIADEIQQTMMDCSKPGHKQLQLPMFG
jgi:hypothetical protein